MLYHPSSSASLFLVRIVLTRCTLLWYLTSCQLPPPASQLSEADQHAIQDPDLIHCRQLLTMPGTGGIDQQLIDALGVDEVKSKATREEVRSFVHERLSSLPARFQIMDTEHIVESAQKYCELRGQGTWRDTDADTDGLTEASAPSPQEETIPIPHGIHHHLLTGLQLILESACFRYMSRKRHDLLKAKEWTCAEAVELHTCVYDMKAQHQINTSSARTRKSIQPSISLPGLSAIDIRHAAVHRELLTTSSLHRMLQGGITFAANSLEDHGTADVLQKLQTRIDECLSRLHEEETKGPADSAQQTSDSTSPASGAQGSPEKQRGSPSQRAGLAIWEAVQQSIAKTVRDPVDEDGEHQAPVGSKPASDQLGCRRMQLCLKVTPDAPPIVICPYHTTMLEDPASGTGFEASTGNDTPPTTMSSSSIAEMDDS